MLKVKNYPNAYKEVYEILKNVPSEDVEKIPKEFMQMLEKNMNTDYKFTINKGIDFDEEQELLPETKIVLGYIYLNYWANEQEKEKINNKLKNDIKEAENQKKENYNNDIFKEKQNQEIIEYKKENFFKSLIKNIKKMFR